MIRRNAAGSVGQYSWATFANIASMVNHGDGKTVSGTDKPQEQGTGETKPSLGQAFGKTPFPCLSTWLLRRE